jgi:hypothetical protein
MRGLQCGDPIQTADGIAIAIGDDAVLPLACEEFTQFRAEIAPDAETMGTLEMIVETTRCAREPVRMR